MVWLYLKHMKLKPLHDNVVVEPITEEETTKAGIVLPDTVDKERPEKGKIVEVGPGKLLENGQRSELGVQKGDVVVFKKFSPEEIKIDNQEYLVISESDILAVVSE